MSKKKSELRKGGRDLYTISAKANCQPKAKQNNNCKNRWKSSILYNVQRLLNPCPKIDYYIRCLFHKKKSFCSL